MLIDNFCVKKRVFHTFSAIFPCNLFESNVKFSVIFQLSCPCNITAPATKLDMKIAQDMSLFRTLRKLRMDLFFFATGRKVTVKYFFLNLSSISFHEFTALKFYIPNCFVIDHTPRLFHVDLTSIISVK